MFLASIDFLPLAATLSSTYSMMFLVWGIFALIPGLVASYAAFERVVRPDRTVCEIKIARNGRLYAVVNGRYPVWSRRGETVESLYMRALGA